MKKTLANKDRSTQANKPSKKKATRSSVATALSEKDDHEELMKKYEAARSNISPATEDRFDLWDSSEFVPQDLEIPVDVTSLEAKVGYSSLIRQFQRGFLRSVAFYRSEAGGALSVEEARARAFHPAKDRTEAMKELNMKLSQPVENLNFVDLAQLYTAAPRVAERLWEEVKREARKEFESGHLAANITFPADYMKQVWNIGRYLGVRESFLAEWKPNGGIEIAMIDMLAQSFFQWQYWLEKTVERSETQEKEEHPAYKEWKRYRVESGQSSPYDGRWIRPFVSEVRAVEHAVQMADRFHRIFMRTLRQLRDLRRYSSFMISNANQVNIAIEGGQQTNIAE